MYVRILGSAATFTNGMLGQRRAVVVIFYPSRDGSRLDGTEMYSTNLNLQVCTNPWGKGSLAHPKLSARVTRGKSETCEKSGQTLVPDFEVTAEHGRG